MYVILEENLIQALKIVLFIDVITNTCGFNPRRKTWILIIYIKLCTVHSWYSNRIDIPEGKKVNLVRK